MSEKIPPDPQDDSEQIPAMVDPAEHGAARPEPPSGSDAELARALEAWRLAKNTEAPAHPSEIPAAEQRETLAELLAQFGQKGLEGSSADAGAEEAPAGLPAEASPPAPAPPPEPEPEAARAAEALGAGLAAMGEREREKEAAQILGKGLAAMGARETALNKKADALGMSWLGERLKGAGDWYNKQKTKDKIVLGLALGALSVTGTLAAGAAVPFAAVLVAACGGGLTAQRILGGIGMFNRIDAKLGTFADYQKRREGFFAKRWDSVAQWLGARPPEERRLIALGLAGLYAFSASAVVGEAVHLATDAAEDTLSALAHLLDHDVASGAPDLAVAAPAQPEPFIRPDAAHPLLSGVDSGVHPLTIDTASPPDVAGASEAAPAALHPEHAAAPHAAAEHTAAQHAARHLSTPAAAAARDRLETEFLNKWQLLHGGTPDARAAMPSQAQIDDYVNARLHPAPAHQALHEVRARLGLEKTPPFPPPAEAAPALAPHEPFHVDGAQIPQDLTYDAPPPQMHIPESPPAPNAEAPLEQAIPASQQSPAPPAPEAPHAAHSAAEAPSADIQMNANGVPIDLAHAHEYTTREGYRIVFGGPESERQQKAFEWLMGNHQGQDAAVYYEVTKPAGFLGLGRPTRHIAMMIWSGSAPSLPVLDPPGLDRLPSVDELAARLD
jgi:hypothetical protein